MPYPHALRRARTVLVLAVSAVAGALCRAEFRAIPDRSFYTSEDSGRLVLLDIGAVQEDEPACIEILYNQRVLASGSIDTTTRYPSIAFPLRDLPTGASRLLCRVNPGAEGAVEAAADLRKLPPSPRAVKIDRLCGGLIVDGLPFLPFGFYCYSPVQPTLAEEEIVRGFTMMSPYQSNSPKTIKARRQYMDRCAELGMKVHYQLLNVAGGGGVYGARGSPEQAKALRDEVNAFKDHPALLAWYISDEPTGHGTKPETLRGIRDNILAEDPYHPVTVVFMRPGRAAEYVDAMDIVMVDPYPIPVRPPTSAGRAVSTVFSALAPEKAVWIVPQCFGGNEHWRREPTAQEARVMTYLGILEGARGVQYFIRHGLNGFPKSPVMWAECSRIALEVGQLTPDLLSSEAQPTVTCSDDDVRVGAWSRQGVTTVIAVNTKNVPRPLAVRLPNSGPADTAEVLFENRRVPVTLSPAAGPGVGWLRRLLPGRLPASGENARSAVIADMIDAYGVRIYRLQSGKPDDPSVPMDENNLVVNPSFEENPSPGTPAACYARVGAGRGATYFVDPRLAVDGRHSLRLNTPRVDEGVGISPYYPRVKPGEVFRFSLWARAAAAGTMPELKMKLGPTGAAHTLSNEWRRYSATGTAVKARNSKLHLYYGLQTPGTVWVDALECVRLAPVLRPQRDAATGAYLMAFGGIPRGAVVHYTLDGTNPDAESPRYSRPFPLPDSTSVKCILIDGEVKTPVTSVDVLRHDANLCPVELRQAYSEKYPGTGPGTLTDGLVGSTSFRHANWQGFVGHDVHATIDFGRVRPVASVQARFLQTVPSWIFLPRGMTVLLSTNGRRFRELGSASHALPTDRKDSFVHTLTVDGDGREARYVRVIAETLGVCPQDHSGAGKDCWVFIDEILVSPTSPPTQGKRGTQREDTP